MIDDKYINNVAKNWVAALFHSRVIRKSVLSRFKNPCIEMPCLCPSKNDCRKVTETSVVELCY